MGAPAVLTAAFGPGAGLAGALVAGIGVPLSTSQGEPWYTRADKCFNGLLIASLGAVCGANGGVAAGLAVLAGGALALT